MPVNGNAGTFQFHMDTDIFSMIVESEFKLLLAIERDRTSSASKLGVFYWESENAFEVFHNSRLIKRI